MNPYEEFSKIQIRLEQMQVEANSLVQRKNQLAQEIIKLEQAKEKKDDKK